MARILQIRRGTTAQNDGFTGLAGELSFDTEGKTLRVHDGVRLGGYPLARADQIPSSNPDDNAAFDINSVSDDFWAAKIPQFAPPALSKITGRAVSLPGSAFLNYVFNTELDPVVVNFVLICMTPDAGYSANDEVMAFGIGNRTNPAPNVFRDSLGLNVRLFIGGEQFWVSHKTTGVNTNITTSSWKFQFRLYC